MQLRTRLQRLEHHSGDSGKTQLNSIKTEQDLLHNNNNNDPPDTSGGDIGVTNDNGTSLKCLLPQFHEQRVQSPVLRSQRHLSFSQKHLSCSGAELSPIPLSAAAVTREDSPISRPVLRNTSASPLLRNIKSEELGNVTVCSDEQACINTEVVSVLRHSPRLESASNNSEANSISCSSPSNKIHYPSVAIKDCLSNGSKSVESHIDKNIQNNILSQTTILSITPSIKLIKKQASSASSRCSSKRSPLHDRLTRSDASNSELDTSDTDSKSDLQVDSPAKSLINKHNQVPTCAANAGTLSCKRKSEAYEEGPDIKKCKSLATANKCSNSAINIIRLTIGSNLSIDDDSDGATNHSLRSRDKNSTPNTSITAGSDAGNDTSSLHKSINAGSDASNEVSSLHNSVHDATCSQFHSLAEVTCEEASQAAADGGVTLVEYERVFVKSATEAASRLRDQNVKGMAYCSVS